MVLEATGDYWRGVYYLLEDTLNVILVNTARAKGRPGRKTDVSDSAWLAPGLHDMVRKSVRGHSLWVIYLLHDVA